MSFQRYPEYKQSNTPWIDAIPKSWGVVQAKRGIAILTDFTANGSFASLAENVEYRSSGYARLIRMTDLRHRLVKEGVWVDEDAYRYLKKSELHGGELLMASVGSVGLVYQMPKVDYPATLAPNMYLLKTSRLLYERYFYWLLLSSVGQDQISQSATTTAQPKLNKDNVRSLILPLPSEAEQLKIAAFLDHETTRIDALVAEQQRLIALLKEKRQAVISHAVTKGLDPDVPMKDSGVEWLGEVPAHWMVGPLRWYATIQGGVAKGKSYSDDTPTVDLPYLRVANVQDGHVDLSSVNTVTVALSEVERYRLHPGDVLMNEGGDNDKLGRGTVWEGEIADCLHQNHVFAIRPNDHLLPHWLSMFTGSKAARSYFYLYSKQSTNLASVSSSNVMSCPIPLPPREEQRQVLDFLGRETARIDNLILEGEKAISFLQERRSALISAAVTGKIDVRGWQPPVGSTASSEATQTEAV